MGAVSLFEVGEETVILTIHWNSAYEGEPGVFSDMEGPRDFCELRRLVRARVALKKSEGCCWRGRPISYIDQLEGPRMKLPDGQWWE